VHVHGDGLDSSRKLGPLLASDTPLPLLTPQRLHRITIGLVAAALIASATFISGSG
jgi:hypothetical protein